MGRLQQEQQPTIKWRCSESKTSGILSVLSTTLLPSLSLQLCNISRDFLESNIVFCQFFCRNGAEVCIDNIAVCAFRYGCQEFMIQGGYCVFFIEEIICSIPALRFPANAFPVRYSRMGQSCGCDRYKAFRSWRITSFGFIIYYNYKFG